MSLPKKAVVLGLDAPIAPRLYNFALKGYLPTFRKLITEGTYAENCLVPFPTITPPNWTTIVTGAWPGTHGITCFNMHKPGMPLTETYPAFDSRDCQAEYIWQAAERVGKKTIIINWPSTWPPTSKELIQIGGAGLSINEWRVDIPRGESFRISISDSLLFSTEVYPLAYQIEFDKPKEWKNVDLNKPSLEAELVVKYRRSRYKVEEETWYFLIQDSSGEGFDIAIIAPERDAKKAFAILRKGEWSKVIVKEFNTEKGTVKAAFKIKLIELSKDGQNVRIFITPISSLSPDDLPVYPPELIKELPLYDDEIYPIATHGVFEAFNLGWIDINTWIECVDMEHVWLSRIASYLLSNKKWDLFFMHMHCPDWSYHMFGPNIDPRSAEDKELVKVYQDAEIKFYQSIDRAINRILKVVGNDTLTVIVSDHGAKPTTKKFHIGQILKEAGLLVTKTDPVTGREVVDLTKSKAIPQRSVYIYINLKGRDPHGIVDPSEYDKVREEVIKALYDYTDPETGKKPILFALKKEDARIIGLYGDRIGDIIFALNPDFGGQHGVYLPTAKWGIGDLRGLLILHGPGIKKGYVMKRTCWLTDIVPTLCYLLEIPIPKHAEGGILYQALEDPNVKLNELRKLREEYEKLKKMYNKLLEAFEKEKALTHTYHEVY